MGSHLGEPLTSFSVQLHYTARAKGGYGLIVTEFTCVDPVGMALPGQLGIWDDSLLKDTKD